MTSLFVTMLFFLLFVFYNVEVFYVKGDSMLPNYAESENIRCVLTIKKPVYIPIPDIGKISINNLSRKLDKFSKLKRGDVVIVKKDNKSLLKRIIGIPGDRILIDKNKIIINGEPVIHEYINENMCEETIRRGNGFLKYIVILNKYEIYKNTIELSEDEYFYMGDNRVTSLDSRQDGPCKSLNIERRCFYNVKNNIF